MMKRQEGGWGVGVWVRPVHHKSGRGRDQSPPYGGGGRVQWGGEFTQSQCVIKIRVNKLGLNCAKLSPA